MPGITKTRICIVGAGPSGMAALYQLGKLDDAVLPEVVCYEKQNTYGGLWNFSWKTGTDEFGEPCHNGQYRHLFSNGPKECLEYPDYTFEDHFGKPIPSYPPRTVLRDYLGGRLKSSKRDVTKWIKFNNVVQNVTYNNETDDFTVSSRDLVSGVTDTQTFSHVIVANGIFVFPNKPEFPGFDSFPGRIIHSHDFRDACEFKGQTVLLIGARYSAEDISMQCMKYGAKRVICTWRSKPMNFKGFPEGIEERPLLQSVKGNTAYFKDGSSADVDSIILCTGYIYHYPFLHDELRLKSNLTLYPNNTYKGVLWLRGGNNKLFYIGMVDQYFSYTVFDAQALWITKFITGTLKDEPRSMADMVSYCDKWCKRFDGLKDCHDDIDFQGDYLKDLSDDTGYHPDAHKGAQLFHEWEYHKDENVSTYRDRSFRSLYTGNMAAPPRVPWFKDFDDSIEAYTGTNKKQ